MNDEPSSYLSSCAVGRTRNGKLGRGVFAARPVKKGEVIAVWGGRVIDLDALVALSPAERRLVIQIEEDRFLYSTVEGPADWVNHSCDPNAGLCGQVVLVAMRGIRRGEEIAFDYAMSDSNPYEEFRCFCKSKQCRKHVTRDDWKRPDLWRRYSGYFSPYLQRRIERLQEAALTADVGGL